MGISVTSELLDGRAEKGPPLLLAPLSAHTDGFVFCVFGHTTPHVGALHWRLNPHLPQWKTLNHSSTREVPKWVFFFFNSAPLILPHLSL